MAIGRQWRRVAGEASAHSCARPRWVRRGGAPAKQDRLLPDLVREHTAIGGLNGVGPLCAGCAASVLPAKDAMRTLDSVSHGGMVDWDGRRVPRWRGSGRHPDGPRPVFGARSRGDLCRAIARDPTEGLAPEGGVRPDHH